MKKNLFKISVIVFILIILAASTYYIARTKRHNNVQIAQNNFINYLDPKLSQDEIKTINDKINQLESQVDKDKKSGDKDALYRSYMALEVEYKLKGKLLEAKNTLLAATELDPTKAPAWAELFQVEKTRTDYNSAEADIKKAIELYPSNQQYWRSYLAFAEDALKFGNDQMKQLYSDALKKTGDNIDVVVLYAGYLGRQGDVTNAIEQWKKAQQINPESKKLYQQEIDRLNNSK